jgi:hypothetical protein
MNLATHIDSQLNRVGTLEHASLACISIPTYKDRNGSKLWKDKRADVKKKKKKNQENTPSLYNLK